jgi:hypothetical protein
MTHNVTMLPQGKGNKSHVKHILLYMCQICLTIFWHMVCQIRLKWSQQRIIVKHILHNMCQMWLCAGARFTVCVLYVTVLHRRIRVCFPLVEFLILIRLLLSLCLVACERTIYCHGPAADPPSYQIEYSQQQIQLFATKIFVA